MYSLSWHIFAVTTYTNQEARLKLREILGRPEFTDNEALAKWLQSAADWLGSLFSRITGRNIRMGSLSTWESFLAVLAAVLVLFIFVWAGLRLYRYFVPDYAEMPAPESRLTSADSDQLRIQASKCADNAQYRDAIRYLYLSLLLFLDKKNLIRYRLSKTNREYLQEYRRNEPGHESFYGLVSFFEGKWYGMEPCSSLDYRQFQAMYLDMVMERQL